MVTYTNIHIYTPFVDHVPIGKPSCAASRELQLLTVFLRNDETTCLFLHHPKKEQQQHQTYYLNLYIYIYIGELRSMTGISIV